MDAGRSQLFTWQLLEGGFSKAGAWSLNVANEMFFSGEVPAQSGVYAFSISGVVLYVGVASQSLSKRLYFYLRPGVSQKTNVRLNGLIREELSKGREVEVYVAQPPNLAWNGWTVRGAEGLEAGIISAHDLPWNVRGAAKAGLLVNRQLPASAAIQKADDEVLRRGDQHAGAPTVRYPGKYGALRSFLESCGMEKISMSFSQLEQLVGSLPKSAYLHPAWWGNHAGNSQAKGWMDARYLAEANPSRRSVVFRKFSY